MRRRPCTAWALSTVAPWCTALALVTAFAADAGQQGLDASQSLRLAAVETPDDLVPPARPATFGFSLPPSDPVLRQARLVIGDPDALTAGDEEAEPKPDLKPHTPAFPTVDRTHRGDPAIGLRPTFDATLRGPGSLAAAVRARMIVAHESHAFEPGPT